MKLIILALLGALAQTQAKLKKYTMFLDSATTIDIERIMTNLGAYNTTIKNYGEAKKIVMVHNSLQTTSALGPGVRGRKLGGRTCPGDSWADCIVNKGYMYCVLHCWDVYFNRALEEQNEQRDLLLYPQDPLLGDYLAFPDDQITTLAKDFSFEISEEDQVRATIEATPGLSFDPKSNVKVFYDDEGS